MLHQFALSVARIDPRRIPARRTRSGLRSIWWMLLVMATVSGCKGCSESEPIIPGTTIDRPKAVAAIKQLGCNASNTGAQLEVLGLTGFDDAKLTELPRYAKLFDSVVLELQDSQVTAAGCKHLANMTNLVSLDLSNLPLTNDSLQHLAPSKDKLESLRLDKTGIDDAALDHLKLFTKLERLYVRDNPGITADRLAKLKSQLPNLIKVKPEPETVAPEPDPNADPK